MSDDKVNRRKIDRPQIDVNDPNELRSWSIAMGVTLEELEAAVQQVGPVAENVREHFKRK